MKDKSGDKWDKWMDRSLIVVGLGLIIWFISYGIPLKPVQILVDIFGFIVFIIGIIGVIILTVMSTRDSTRISRESKESIKKYKEDYE